MFGMPVGRRFITATGPSAYFCFISGFSMSFISVQYGMTYWPA